jgi:cytidine deaminase
MPTNEADLLVLARQAAAAAYSPYSKFKVGAAVLFSGAPRVYTGCNIENASYGLTMCAERVAIFSGVADGHKRITQIAIAVLDENYQPAKCFQPCGACLQVISEFANHETKILLAGTGRFILRDFLPAPFRLF